ncbi:MAG: glycosyltransferase 2 family protein [Candidatus Woesearchaeota archaeon]|nr:glycosyltransferase 2 family protein [Candidatus Woesearchaeota archaeon]
MNKYFKFAISLFATGIIVYLLFRKIDISTLVKLSREGFVALGFSTFLFFLIKMVNTFRYSKLYNLKAGIKLFSLLSYSNLMLNIFPFRTGEISYIRGFKKYFNIRYSEGLNKLVLLRFIDYLVIYIIFLISSICVYNNVEERILELVSLFFVISLVFFFGFIYFITSKKVSFNFKSKKINNILKTIRIGIKDIRKIPMNVGYVIVSLSFLYWILRLISGYVVLRFLGLNIPFSYLTFVSLLLLLIGILPIRSFLGFGIFEGGWAYFLIPLGYQYDLILPLVLQYHLILLIPSIIFGAFGFFILRIISKLSDKP